VPEQDDKTERGGGWTLRRPLPSSVVVVVLALMGGVFGGLLLAAFVAPKSSSRVYSAESVDTFSRTREVVVGIEPVELRSLDFYAHGGETRIEWSTGAWAPTRAQTRSALSIYIDGERSATAVLGGYDGQFEARPGTLRWVGRLRRGRHRIEVKVDSAESGFAIPLVRPGTVTREGLYVEEYAG